MLDAELAAEAELLDLVEPAREKAVDVPLLAQPRDRLVNFRNVKPERTPGRLGVPLPSSLCRKTGKE